MTTRRARASHLPLLASLPLVALVALVTLAAGCGTVRTPPSGGAHGTTAAQATAAPTTAAPAPATATPVPTTTGGSVPSGQSACTGWPANAAHGSLPASFIPVAVLRCVLGDQLIPGKGEWQTATLERADKDLGPLIAALRLPRGRTTPAIMCPASVVLPPQIALINGEGKTLIPLIPLNGCGTTAQQVLVALGELHWQTVSVRLVSQVETEQEVATGCAPVYMDPFAADRPIPASAGGAVYPAWPASLRICVYSSGGIASATQFVGGATVTGATKTDLLAGLSSGRSTGLCGLPHAKFAVVAGAGSGSPAIYVELGGCDRVYRYASGTSGLLGVSTGQATPQAVSIIESLTLRG
ncbi:hypothetical protein [Trebonia sp.]|uniref:hypothetical protein n=1 Tax=Trebonia sp. TaxID=2767075 RepID=UPI002622B95D|nr:hypothetical protein [Trebonia sp.]